MIIQKLTRKKNQKGFTLIELMIVIAIIGILAAIAIPQFAAYRMKSYNSAALSDVRNFNTSQASFFADWQVFGGAGGAADAVQTGPSIPGTHEINGTEASGATRLLDYGLGRGVTVGCRVNNYAAGLGTNFTAEAKHLQGDTPFAVDSDTSAVYTDPSAIAAGTALVIGNVEAPTTSDDYNGTGNWVAK